MYTIIIAEERLSDICTIMKCLWNSFYNVVMVLQTKLNKFQSAGGLVEEQE